MTLHLYVGVSTFLRDPPLLPTIFWDLTHTFLKPNQDDAIFKNPAQTFVDMLAFARHAELLNPCLLPISDIVEQRRESRSRTAAHHTTCFLLLRTTLPLNHCSFRYLYFGRIWCRPINFLPLQNFPSATRTNKFSRAKSHRNGSVLTCLDRTGAAQPTF